MSNNPSIEPSEKAKRYLQELNDIKLICEEVKNLPLCAGRDRGEVFSIIEHAFVLGISPIKALTGGLWSVRGKVEMSARLMNEQIVSAGHKIRVIKNDGQVCELEGERKDNGHKQTESFTLEEAQQAGVYNKNGPWGKYSKDLLYARALSRLARRLFADVIGHCYVEGELTTEEIKVKRQPLEVLNELEKVGA